MALPDFVPAAARARIAQLDVDIQNLHGSTPDAILLEREIQKLHQELADYKYPVLTLPTEITSEIFIQFLPPYPARPSLFGKRSPSFLLRICRTWRDRHLLEAWLQRSGSLPLSIAVQSEYAVDSRLITPVMDAILSHAPRWQEMDICLPFDKLRPLTGPMPLLRSLKLGPTELLSGSFSSEPPVALFMQAPNLEDVTLSEDFSPFFIILPWSQITTLTASPYVDEAVEMLRQTPRLVHCTLMVYDWDELDLRRGSSGDGIQWLFKALTLPSLEVIRVPEFLGADHIAALSALRPKGYPSTMEITRAATAHSVYAQAFPEAQISVRTISEYSKFFRFGRVG
ncbi:hypothetical protein FB45DRAFT_1027281 [Roridomyces roridus]|uniref:F-box domain-containing protein n=1 Tax=Roridomyces roridus TaxID=1738132 RepID=A0AAD7BZ06_9AGAR|nr:hypothetical protein FB45DRAFT_1027281 [Roridomyces roridus]